MLSAKTIEIVKSTVPLLQEKGVEITTRFYEILFSNIRVIEYFQPYKSEKGRQQQALANAVYATSNVH